MKTRYKIITIGLVLTTIVFGSYQYVMYECGTMSIFKDTPRMPNLLNCLSIWEHQSKQPPVYDQKDISFEDFIDEELGNPSTVNFSFCGADGFDSKGNLNTDNSTHLWNENECTWQIIENVERDSMLAAGYKLYPGVGWVSPDEQNTIVPIYTEHPDTGDKVQNLDAMLQVKQIFNHCNSTDGKFAYGLEYSNGTHYIDNNICEWQLVSEQNLHVTAFTDGITEIVNPEHSPLKYKDTIPTINDTYLSKNN